MEVAQECRVLGCVFVGKRYQTKGINNLKKALSVWDEDQPAEHVEEEHTTETVLLS